jgi:hypothetical protein
MDDKFFNSVKDRVEYHTGGIKRELDNLSYIGYDHPEVSGILIEFTSKMKQDIQDLIERLEAINV